ncbi:SPRY domain-containing protein [Lysinibacillus sphaericus]|uniref:SPRY domain-containing protein n=1 Tax=Lysinibacillus sphaericus TaxID=1421 RepID=UPI002162B236|nr:SPRY domain-containing protein [Lysinibacillus sphaericus]MCS1382584.1 SPRY domain-containing protein [Lysinibacillus sphaericus]
MTVTWSSTLKSTDATVSSDGKTASIRGGWAVTQENITSGKHYFEFVINTYAQIVIGISQSISAPIKPTESQVRAIFGYDGNKVYPRSTYGSSFNASNIIGMAIEMDVGEISFTKDGVNLGVAFRNLKDLGEIKLYVSTSTIGGNESITIVDDLDKMKYSDVARDFLFHKCLALKNPSNHAQPYSLSHNTLIHLSDNSPQNMVLWGVEKGKEVQLDTTFTKQSYPNDLSSFENNIEDRILSSKLAKKPKTIILKT